VDVILKKISCDEHGYFGDLQTTSGSHLVFVGSHAYQGDEGSWDMKVQPGSYDCVRKPCRIMDGPNHTLGEFFESFEVEGVAGHTGILLGHKGNWPQIDSDGCFIFGLSIGVLNEQPAVMHSASAMLQFMGSQSGAPRFTLTVLA